MKTFPLYFVFFFSLIGLVCPDPWWHHTIIYQIYPRSFQDSDGDGVGDLKGIASRLDYIINIGAKAIWLSPIYESPMKDFGYDISNFKEIDPVFGSLDDFDHLVFEAHNKGIKVILDFVPNHSSDKHDWFIRSELREDPFSDYYVWRDKRGVAPNGDPIPPNNWISRFRNTAWKWSEIRQQFYFHKYAPEQPDLNYRNPLIVKEMKDVLKFWMSRGVDGFRMDAVPFLVEDDQFRDEALSGNTNDSNSYHYTQHIYTDNLPETRAVLTELWNYIREYSSTDGRERVTMLQVSLSLEEQVEYYNCGDYPFNFQLTKLLSTPPSALEVKRAIESFLLMVPTDRQSNWLFGSHDHWRASDRFDHRAKLIDGMNLLIMTLPGVAITYYGEELGMRNNFDISYAETRDPRGINCGPVRYLEMPCSRDPQRTGMQWDRTANSGFTSGNPWIPMNNNYESVNVAVQNSTSYSHLENYKHFSGQSIRYFSPTFDNGKTKVAWNNKDVIAVGRFHDDPQLDAFATVINFGFNVQTINIFGEFHPFIRNGLVLADTYRPNSSIPKRVPLSLILLKPLQALTLYLTDNSSGESKERSCDKRPSLKSPIANSGKSIPQRQKGPKLNSYDAEKYIFK